MPRVPRVTSSTRSTTTLFYPRVPRVTSSTRSTTTLFIPAFLGLLRLLVLPLHFLSPRSQGYFVYSFYHYTFYPRVPRVTSSTRSTTILFIPAFPGLLRLLVLPLYFLSPRSQGYFVYSFYHYYFLSPRSQGYFVYSFYHYTFYPAFPGLLRLLVLPLYFLSPRS